ncbi:MAG: energy transducer TonB [Bacteroidetes bacterium]|nr:energy transducer TonB [Bacteroidota bacterium]
MKYLLTISIIFWTVLLFAQTDNAKAECKSLFDSLTNRTVYLMVDQLPEFPGGANSLKRFILNNLIWPNDGQDDFQGTVYVSVMVETDGNLTNKIILKGIYDLADKEALRIIDKMPKWKPGKCNGKVVPVKYCIPIKFRME